MEWKPAIVGLETKGLFVFDDFWNPTELRKACQERFHSGYFRGAGVGKNRTERSEIRSDQIDWWEPGSLSEAQRDLAYRLDLVREVMNREFFLNLVDWEGHFARYGQGEFYQKHLDQFRTDDKRTVSTVFYLNESWEENDGGELVVYPENSPPEYILPLPGRLVIFLSDRVPHEVKPAHRERWSVAGWFRCRPPC